MLADFDGTDGDTTFLDQSPNGVGLTFTGGAELDSAQAKFGSTSLLIPNTSGAYMDISSDLNLALGTGDFTIEFWGRLNAINAGSQFFYDQRTSGTQVVPTLYKDGSDDRLKLFVNGSVRITGPVLSASTWYHIALCRVGGVTRLFVDGSQEGSDYTDSNDYIQNRIRVGEAGDANGSPLNGWIDDMRVTVGFARYPSTSDFYPRTSANPLTGGGTPAINDVVLGDADADNTKILGKAVEIAAPLNIGDKGFENNAVTLDGVTSSAVAKINEFGGAEDLSMILHRHADGPTVSANLLMSRARGTTGAHTDVQDNDELGRFTFAGWHTSSYYSAAQIIAKVAGTPGAGDMPGELLFLVSPDGSNTPAEALRINPDRSLILKNGPGIYEGAGSPEGAVTAAVGSTYHRNDGGTGTSFYVKESGTGNTGWVAK